MRALLQTIWMTDSGFDLSFPEQCEIDIPDGDHHAGDKLSHPEGGWMFVVGKRDGVVVLRRRVVHVPMLAKVGA